MREYSIGISQGLEPVLPAEQIERLVVIGQERELAKGAFFYQQDERADKIYLLLSGRATSLLVGTNGQESLLHSDPELGDYLIRLLLDRMSDFYYRVGELSSQSVQQRLSKALLALSQPDGAECGEAERATVTLTHQQLAHLLNTRRPTVSAALRRLAEAGLIARSDGGITVTDRNGLAGLATGQMAL